MNYRGDVIEESLQDKSVLKNLNIINTRVEKVTSEHRTPWLKKWTLDTIEVQEGQAERLAETLSKAIELGYWYIDYKNDHTHFVIFPNKIFKIDRKNPKEYVPAIKHGLTLNIPRYQLDFGVPESKQWERPKE